MSRHALLASAWNLKRASPSKCYSTIPVAASANTFSRYVLPSISSSIAHIFLKVDWSSRRCGQIFFVERRIIVHDISVLTTRQQGPFRHNEKETIDPKLAQVRSGSHAIRRDLCQFPTTRHHENRYQCLMPSASETTSQNSNTPSSH